MKSAEKLFNTLENTVFKFLDKLAFFCAALSVGVMLFCVTLQVAARMTAISANWTTEVSQYCFLWSTTFASYIAARRGKLIGVELIQNMMPSFVKRIMKFISWMACACFYYIAIYYCCPNLPKLMSQTTPVLKWSMGVIYIIMLVGLAMLTLYSVYTAFYHLLVPEKKKDDSEKTAAEIAEEVE